MTDASGKASQYADKPASYFGNSRHDMVAKMPDNPAARVIEIGCGEGGTGAAALAAGKAGYYLGIELSPAAAKVAAQRLSNVVVADVESVDLGKEAPFDVLVMSEVIEHLTDPWSTLAKLSPHIRSGGMFLASSPNVAHWQVIRGLISGRFSYAESGVMDSTHLRWFTPSSYSALIEGAGFVVEKIEPIKAPNGKKRLFNRLTGNRFAHLTMTQMMITARKRD